MITELYIFAPSSYVIADEWNANFRVIYNENVAHVQATTDALAAVAFPTSDLTDLFDSVRSYPNSYGIPGTSVNVLPECEYYKTLSSGEDLVINIPSGMNAEARVLIRLQEDRTLLPFSVNYVGTSEINYGFYNYNYFRSGYYYIMIYESNGVAQVKLIWTGV